ncbi:hypothetical protein ACF3NG_06545 [Aerococcaceae bacterium WGS1372]
MVQAFNLPPTSFACELTEAKIKSMSGIATESLPLLFLDLIPNNILSVMSSKSNIVSIVIIASFFTESIRFLRNKKVLVVGVVILLTYYV